MSIAARAAATGPPSGPPAPSGRRSPESRWVCAARNAPVERAPARRRRTLASSNAAISASATPLRPGGPALTDGADPDRGLHRGATTHWRGSATASSAAAYSPGATAAGSTTTRRIEHTFDPTLALPDRKQPPKTPYVPGILDKGCSEMSRRTRGCGTGVTTDAARSPRHESQTSPVTPATFA